MSHLYLREANNVPISVFLSLFSQKVKTKQMINGFYEILYQKCSLKFLDTSGKREVIYVTIYLLFFLYL